MTTSTTQQHETTKKKNALLFFDILLVFVLIIGGILRATNLFWGEYQYLHPDERFLVWVGTDITPITGNNPETGEKEWISFSEYFDTANSPLNPNNRGHGFYVYGTLPMFLTRYVVEWIFGHSGFDTMTQVGRVFSALADLFTVLLVYLVASRIYNKRVGILAAAFSALVVLQIQLSHFFTMDTFVNFFSFLAFYFAVRIQTSKRPWNEKEEIHNPNQFHEPDVAEIEIEEAKPFNQVLTSLRGFIHHPLFLPSLGFGIAFGMAMSSKLNALPVAIVLPAAVLLRIMAFPKDKRWQSFLEAIWYLILAGLISFLVFRILQPYAFSGPGFFSIKPNSAWLAQIRELRNQASPDVDFPPAMQWARRSVFFSFINLTRWGLGLPLGILSWIGFIWIGWRILQGEWQKHALIWGWTAVYFTWQSMALNPTMRYQLPIYPTLVIFAGWAVSSLYDLGFRAKEDSQASPHHRKRYQIAAITLGSIVLLLTAAYAFGFARIYARPITRLEASRWIYQNIPGPINLHIETSKGRYNQPVPFYYDTVITQATPYITNFVSRENGTLREVYLPHVYDILADNGEKTLHLYLSDYGENKLLQSSAVVTGVFTNENNEGYTFILDTPLLLTKDNPYELKLILDSATGALSLEGDTLANEGEWDDSIPYRVEGYDPFGGIYPRDINFNMYWEENPQKLERFLNILDQSDYIAITSSRQWGSLPRIPERFPMSTIYYRTLLGCPPEKSIEWCYNVAEPEMFSGELGFDLVKTFTSNPSLGPIEINDQFAEEAFTVYDHPKVFIFKKNQNYDPAQVEKLLGAVDFSRIIRLPPLQYKSYPADLMLPEPRQKEQSQGGTWSELYNTDGLLNRYPLFGALIWYLSLGLLGWIVYPILRLALPGLKDRGYPLARIAGLLLLSYIVWLAGSMRIPFTRTTITAALSILVIFGGFLAYRQRHELINVWRSQKRYILIVEGLMLAFFILDLLIRYGNPDLWHPWKGGEKPMDFAYLNAILKSTSFPPYDPWYAGGYLNYYYYGFLLVGVLVKWLGIVPSIAYNLIIPTIFSLIAMGSFSIVWNLISAHQSNPQNEDPEAPQSDKPKPAIAYIASISAAIGVALLGNLGTVKMIVLGFQRLVAPGGVLEGVSNFTRTIWTIEGFFKSIGGSSLPYAVGDWYWLPSRIIPAPGEIEPITEFPFFTVLYADPHAHLFALPITLLAISFALGLVLSRAHFQSKLGAIIGLIFGALIVGALRPTNTWDFPTYLALSIIAIGYALWRNQSFTRWWNNFPLLKPLPDNLHKAMSALGGILIFGGLAFVLFQPYAHWYALGYTKIILWQGTRTPLHAYFLHWGLFLFLIVSWMIWETIDWMAKTPVSALKKLSSYREIIWVLIALLVLLVIALGIKLPGFPDSPFGKGINVAWVVLPLAAWAGILILRKNQPDTKRFVLFLIGTGLILTLMVEIIVLQGDIGRMNTVFKFYLQVWTILGISAAAAIGWLLPESSRWSSGWRNTWQVILVLLVAGAALYPLMAGRAKIEDRMATEAPHTLDGMRFMEYATYNDSWGPMDLSEDYRAIRWLQENVEGSPVILEANLRNLYRWGSRISNYTGLPSVVGWEWHQQQQRSTLPGSWITDRILEIEEFYVTPDAQRAQEIIQKYDVSYIIVGQQERGLYAGPGLDKFEAYNGILWEEVYRDSNTVIYKVL